MKRLLIVAALILALTVSVCGQTANYTYQTGNASGASWYWYNTSLSTGDMFKLRLNNTNLSTGKYINCYQGTTSVWSIGEDGATAISSAVASTNSLSVTNNVTTSGDLVTLTADDDTLDADTFYLRCLGATNHTTEVFTIGEGGQTVITPTAAAITADALTITGTLLTTGDAISISAVDATLNGSKYLNCLGGSGSTAVATIAEDGVTALTGTAVGSNMLTITNLATTSGDFITLDGDDDTIDADTYYLHVKGGTDHETTVLTIGEGGIITGKGGATIDNATSATVLDLAETTVRASGAFDVTGNSTLASLDVGGGSGGSGLTVAATGAITADGVAALNGGITVDTSAFAVADTTGIVTLADGGTIDGQSGTDVLNLTETTVRATGNFDVTGTGTVAGVAALNGGITVDTSAFTVADTTGAVATTSTLTSQTTENIQESVSLTTDSTFLTGTDITYSGGRGSEALKVTGTWSGASGGYCNVYSNLTKSGATSAAVDGAMGMKSIVTNTGAMTDGSVYGGWFWAKHSHASADMANEAALIGLEGCAYDATSGGTAGTMIGVNAVYHNEVDTAKPAGSVHRALQVVCDDAAGADAADEATGIAIWNMAGTQTNGIKFVRSGSGFASDIALQYGEQINNTVDGEIALVGTLTAPQQTVVAENTATRVCTSADFGKMIIISTAGACDVTLPANGATAGSYIDFLITVENAASVTIAAAAVDTLYGPNDVDLDSVAFATTQRIGSYCRVISNGANWVAVNLGTTTMTAND